ncbi:MAG: LolA family protein [Saprospiraceae bacterium]
MKKTLSFAGLLFFFSGFTQAQNAEDIVAKHITAIGGDNWTRVEAVKSEAKISADGAPGMSIMMNMLAVRDKSLRMDVSVMGMTQTSVLNGDAGWSINPFANQMDPEPLTADQVKSMKDMTDVDGTLVGYKAKGYTVEYVGTEDVDGVEAVKIKINKGEKRSEYSFFDPATFYEIKNIRVEEVDGKMSETATVYSNFKNQDGLVFPFTIQQADPNMGGSTVTITSVVVNPLVDMKVFEAPAK